MDNANLNENNNNNNNSCPSAPDSIISEQDCNVSSSDVNNNDNINMTDIPLINNENLKPNDNSLSNDKSVNKDVFAQRLIMSNFITKSHKETNFPNSSIVKKETTIKRRKKSCVDSPVAKNRRTEKATEKLTTEKPINEIFKNPSIIDNNQKLNLKLNRDNEDSKAVFVTPSENKKSEYLDTMQHQIDAVNKEKEDILEKSNSSRYFLLQKLIETTKIERKIIKEKVHKNKLLLGEFVSKRCGINVEKKWVEGEKFVDLEKRKKLLEEQREENERKKKILKKQNRIKLPNISNADLTEYYLQFDINDNRKQNINKEEKDLLIEMDLLERERNSHIREIKRIENEEVSKYHDFQLLNERYLVLSLLGKGGFSEVYKAYDMDLSRYVACKIHELNSSWNEDKKESYMKHATREIKIHKSLSHPRIVNVFDIFHIDNSTFCTVLEFCEGNDLDFYLKQKKWLPEWEAKVIINQIVSALRYLNDRPKPIIHYDLKPGNILLCNQEEIKITDFGLSKIFQEDDHNDGGMELTSQGAGTYWYLPPECFVTDNGPPTISSKVDVWSVGVIFFQCLYGKKPFGNNMTQTDILHNRTILQAKTIDFPTNPKVSDAAKDFIRKCCTYQKENRPDVLQLQNEDYLKSKPRISSRNQLDEL